MKWFLLIVVFFPVTLSAQSYKVKKTCMGNGTFAVVVEHDDQYFVVQTPEYFQRSWGISEVWGINLGGWGTLNYVDDAGSPHQMDVQILSRVQWRYAGLPGAISVCRQVTQSGH